MCVMKCKWNILGMRLFTSDISSHESFSLHPNTNHHPNPSTNPDPNSDHNLAVAVTCPKIKRHEMNYHEMNCSVPDIFHTDGLRKTIGNVSKLGSVEKWSLFIVTN